MTVEAGLRRTQQQLARVIPHNALLSLPGEYVPGAGEDEYGNPLPGTTAPGAELPCHAARISASDALKAGFSGVAEVWRVVTNATEPRITPNGTLTVTLEGGMVVELAVQKVSGTHRQIIMGEVTGEPGLPSGP